MHHLFCRNARDTHHIFQHIDNNKGKNLETEKKSIKSLLHKWVLQPVDLHFAYGEKIDLFSEEAFCFGHLLKNSLCTCNRNGQSHQNPAYCNGHDSDILQKQFFPMLLEQVR